MENHLCVLLREAKYDPKKMEQLISLFSPLIKKYAGKLFYMDAEDAEQEMKLAFLIAVHSMSYYNSEGECVSYIRNGLYRRFCALCRGNYQNSEEATEDSKLCEYGFTEKYDDVETLFDYEMLLTNQPIVYSRIFRLLLAGYSDKEIGEILHCSKQYVNRIKKKIKHFNEAHIFLFSCLTTINCEEAVGLIRILPLSLRYFCQIISFFRPKL